jgi:hypothetical protein
MLLLLGQALDEFIREWRRRSAIDALNGLDDHLLDDIGLRRDQLPLLMIEGKSRADWAVAIEPGYEPELQICG